jgi:Asp/Glu/hydantoin racemase
MTTTHGADGADDGNGRAGRAIGVICLDTSFTKIPGHIRNRATFGFPVVYHVVAGATPERVVSHPDPTLLQPFIRAARELEAAGVSAITSACGFLALFQRELADSVRVPLYSSSLMQVPMVYRMLPAGRRVGLLTASKRSLTRCHLEAVGAESVPVCIAGMEDQPEFREVILEGKRDDLDPARLGREVLSQAEVLARDSPDLGALVLECTDLVPFAHLIQARIGVPVFDIVTLTGLVHASLNRRPVGAASAMRPSCA